MSIRIIDAETDPRIEHFEHFLAMPDPFVTLTVQMDITEWYGRLRGKGYPFFLSFQYEVAAAANSVPEFRRRIRNGRVIEYDVCGASYTAALPDGTYRYCDVRTDLPFEEYLKEAKVVQEQALKQEHLVESEDPESRFFISCVPWLSYSSLEMPKPSSDFSVPSITWGRLYTEKALAEKDGVPTTEERVKIPVTVMVNHALADGIHISRFFSKLEERLGNR